MDRNSAVSGLSLSLYGVALLAEGVDRNPRAFHEVDARLRSPSSRRAWIEICACWEACETLEVALLAEGVDRNNVTVSDVNDRDGSPSSRRAWIEIRMMGWLKSKLRWSPSSRRAWIEMASVRFVPVLLPGRPPRGGRG